MLIRAVNWNGDRYENTGKEKEGENITDNPLKFYINMNIYYNQPLNFDKLIIWNIFYFLINKIILISKFYVY